VKIKVYDMQTMALDLMLVGVKARNQRRAIIGMLFPILRVHQLLISN